MPLLGKRPNTQRTPQKDNPAAMEGMDLRSRRNISVCVRIRPLIEQELRKRDTQAVWAATRGFLRYNPPGRPPTSPSRNVIEAGNFDNASSDDPQMYPFDDVFGPESSTREVYDRVCRDSVRSVIDGFNSAICAYGQTSSGKTHTILGSQQRKGDEPCEGGMLFHACSDLFKFIQTESLREPERHFELSMSYLEIYQEQLTDLLNGKDIRAFLNTSEHADGERRGPVSIRRYLKTRLTDDLSDATLRSDLALGVRRRHAPKSC